MGRRRGCAVRGVLDLALLVGVVAILAGVAYLAVRAEPTVVSPTVSPATCSIVADAYEIHVQPDGTVVITIPPTEAP